MHQNKKRSDQLRRKLFAAAIVTGDSVRQIVIYAVIRLCLLFRHWCGRYQTRAVGSRRRIFIFKNINVIKSGFSVFFLFVRKLTPTVSLRNLRFLIQKFILSI